MSLVHIYNTTSAFQWNVLMMCLFFFMSNMVHFLGHVCLQVGYSAPTQSGIVDEVGLSISEVRDTTISSSGNKLPFQCTQSFFSSKCYLSLKSIDGQSLDYLTMHFNLQFAIFGSILTIGAMVGAVTSGRLADFLGRKMVKLLHCQLRRIFLVLLKIILTLYPLFWFVLDHADISYYLHLWLAFYTSGQGLFIFDNSHSYVLSH